MFFCTIFILLTIFLDAIDNINDRTAPLPFPLLFFSGTKDYKLILGGSHSTLVGYTDTDWGSQNHCHSISGFTFFIGDRVVSWSSKKQPIITLTSTEAEYVALTHSSKDIIWIQKLLTEFSFIFTFTVPTTLFCDNQGTIHLLKDSTFHG